MAEVPKGFKPEDLQRLERVGFDAQGKMPRAGSFIVSDDKVLEAQQRERGVEILPLRVAIEKYRWVKDLVFSLVSPETDEFTKAAAQKPPVGYFIHAFEGKKVAYPVQACFFLKTARFAQIVHNIVVVEPNAELHIITGCTTAHYVKQGMHVGITEYFVREGGVLTYTMIHEWAPEVETYPRSAALVEKNGVFISNYIALTPVKMAQMDPKVHVKEKAITRFYSILYGPKGSNLDVGGTAILEGKGARAEIVSRAVSNGGRIITRGRIIGEAEAAKGHMECDGLLLGNDGFIHAIPELKGVNPDVELSHEAAVGKIAQEEIDYLMSRGLDEDTARALIVRGFLDVQIKGLPESLQKRIDLTIEQAAKGY